MIRLRRAAASACAAPIGGGDRGHFLRVAAGTRESSKTEDGEIAPGGGGFTAAVGIWMQRAVSCESSNSSASCRIWSLRSETKAGTSLPLGQVLHSALNKPGP